MPNFFRIRHIQEVVRTQLLIALLAERKKPLTEYDENQFNLTVKEIWISEKQDITFCLHNGLKLTEKEGTGMQWHMLIGYKVVNSRITVYENHNYLGTEYYAQIIERELFDRVQERREQVRAQKARGCHRTGRNVLTEFDGELYRKLVKKLVFYKGDTTEVIFLNGNNIRTGYQ